MKVGTDAVLLGAWAKTYNVRRILDIGTGTGVIALMLAQRSGAKIDAIDIDIPSCMEARENVRNSPWHDRIEVHQTSFQDFAQKHDQQYELIVSNPPYFTDAYKGGEKQRALARHTESLPFEELVYGVNRLLHKEGKFCLILPPREAEQVRVLALAKGLHLQRLTRVKTTPEKAEKRWLMQFGYVAKPQVSDSTLVIELDNANAQHYSEAYKELTRDYYLYF